MRRRRQQRNGRFLVGTVVGIVAGFIGGTALLRGAATSDETIEVIGERVDDGATETFAGRVQESASTTQGQLRIMVDALKSRWHQAMTEGKAAAADRERELESRLAFERKQVPALEGELIQKIEESLGLDNQDRQQA
ncbi:MAG: hypothetical protein AB7R89_29505 [Dehalococcoidia bacterium]